MKTSKTLLALLALESIRDVSSATAQKDHPVGKVIKLLQSLSAQVKSEGQAEAVSFQKFTYWCQTSTAEVQDAIQQEKETIDMLESTIEAKSKESASLGKHVAELAEEILSLQASDKAASEDAAERTALYEKQVASLKSTITAIDDAIKALQGAGKATDSKLLLSQNRLAQGHVRDVLALVATVATDDQQALLLDFAGSEAAPDVNKHTKKYSFKSNNVIELLKTLKEKFEDELTEKNKEETNAANAHALSKGARDAAMKAAQKSKDQRTTDEADAKAALEKAQSDLKDQQGDLKADTASLQSTTDSCSMKSSEWRERTALREQEVKAIAAAIEILGKVSGVRTEAPSNPVLPGAPVKLLQIDASPPGKQSLQVQAVQLLHATAKTYHSKALETLATEVSSRVPSQFQGIINQIQKMIFRLKQEQTDEDNHKAWCDLETSKTETAFMDKSEKLEEVKAKIKEADATVVSLTAEIQAAQKMISDIHKFQAEATQIRNTAKRENSQAIKDAADAQRAITNAVSVLTTFYKDSGSIQKEPWEFLQEPVKLPENPALWSSPYTGVTDPTKASTGIITVLEAVMADFAKMEADTRAQEVTDAKEFEDAMKKQSIELARRKKESEMKNAQKSRLLNKITEMNGHKKHVSDELEATNQYFTDLGPACRAGDSTYPERKAARDAEIKALGEAQQLLDKAFAAPGSGAAGKKFLQIQAHA